MMGADIQAFHLPPELYGADLAVIAAYDGVRALAPVLSPDDIDAVCRSLMAARSRLMRMPVARVIEGIDAAARRLLDPDSPWRQQALLGITAFSGYSPGMAAYVLDRMAADWLAAPLTRLVDVELGGAAAVESFVDRAPGVRTHAVAPALGLHVLAGNVPGVGVTSVVRALLVRSAVLAKSAAGEPVLTPVFARLLAEVDPELGACVAATWWQGGDEALESAVLRHAGLVVHYGGAAAIASLRDRAAPHVRFVEHGPRISFAICNAAAPAHADAATALARAVATFDQQGCVSPQVVYVMGPPDAARSFAADLAAALDHLHYELPRGRISAGEAVAIRELRTRAEFRGLAGRAEEVWAGERMSYTVVLTPDVVFEGTCLNRTVLVKPAESLDVVLEAARPFGRLLQTVGLHGFAGQDRDDIAMKLAAVGATRVTPISAMAWPPPAWHHDGHGPLHELVRWVDVED